MIYCLISPFIISCRMTSPKKTVDSEKDTTFFGELEKVDVHRLFTQTRTKKLNQQLTEELSTLKNLTNEFQAIEKEGKHTTEESKTKLLIEVKMFEEKM
jgi:hypothetical protein